MSRRLKKLITTHTFNPNSLPKLTLGPNTRLNADDPLSQPRLELVPTAPGVFPTTSGLYVKTRLVRPTTMKQCIGFELNDNQFTVNKAQVTFAKFRLSTDGTDELYWDGASWRAANTGEWNTEADVANNIASFPMANGGIQVVINLSTTNPAYTPQVFWIKVLWLSDIEYIESYVVRSFMPALQAGVQPIADYTYALQQSDNLGQVTIKTPTKYVITGIDSVYNLTTDPTMLTDISGAWNPTTMTVALTTPGSVGDRLHVRFIYSPVVSLTTDQEFSQVARLPALNIENVNQENMRYILGSDTCFNRATGAGWKLPLGTQVDLAMDIRMITDKEKDAQRMAEAFTSFFWNNTLLTVVGLDEEFTMIVDRDVEQKTVPSAAGLHGARVAVRI